MTTITTRKNPVIVRKPKLETWSWSQIISEYVPTGWQKIFNKTTDERRDIAQVLSEKVLDRKGDLFPAKEHLYHAFDLVPFDQVKVVILGQDPYPQPGKAQGLAFSLSPKDRQIPGSLNNIYREIKREYPDFNVPNHGDLRGWTKQGVLLINMALTFPAGGRPGAHLGVWRPFLVKTLREMVEQNPDLIFVLWGNEAQKVAQYLDNSIKLVSGHPSPQAVNRGGDFIGNGHFTKINEILVDKGEEPINWQL